MENCGTTCKRIKILAEQIIKMSDTNLKKSYIKDRLNEIANATGGIKQELIKQLATDIVSNKQYEEQYPELRKYLSKVKLWISDRDKNDVYGIGNFSEFRKKYFGVINITKSGVMVDRVYQELNSEYPWLFPDTITHPGEQLLTIAEVSKQLKTGYRINSESEKYDIQEISIYIRKEIGSMKNSIDLRFDIGQEVYMIVKDAYQDKRVESGKVKEISLDSKGWHMHVNGRRYSLESPLMFETEYEAMNRLEQIMASKRK